MKGAGADGRSLELRLKVPLAGFEVDIDTRLTAPITVIMGPSGAGKTTLLEAVAGLRPAVRGRVALGEHVLLDTERSICLPPERRRLAYVPQDAGLFPHLTAHANIRFAMRAGQAQVDATIDLLGIGHLLDRRPASLSGGERQRVALARALACDPDLLLLDEPLAAIDVDLRERIVPYLLRLQGEWRIPILYVTHNAGEALALGGEMLAVEAGRVVAQGPPVDLLSVAAQASLSSTSGLENLLRGKVEALDATRGITSVRILSGQDVAAPFAEACRAGQDVMLAIRAEDILVSVSEPHGLSARNVFESHVLSLHRAGHDVVVRAEDRAGTAWMAILTPAAVESLFLQPGKQLWLAVKSHSIRMV